MRFDDREAVLPGPLVCVDRTRSRARPFCRQRRQRKQFIAYKKQLNAYASEWSREETIARLEKNKDYKRTAANYPRLEMEGVFRSRLDASLLMDAGLLVTA